MRQALPIIAHRRRSLPIVEGEGSPFVLYEGIARVLLPVSDLAAACAPFERLGLVVSPAREPQGRGIRIRTVPVGGPDNLFEIELVGQAETPGGGWVFGDRVDRGLSTVVLRVSDMATALAALAERGIRATSHTILGANGERRIELAMLPDLPDAAASIRLIQHFQTPEERFAEDFGGRQHAMPLKRLDHLAAVAPDLERSCTFWDEVLGVPTVGEVVSPTIVVRQLKIGDAILELLGPSTPDSPIRQRPPGLGSSCSFEVPDLDAAIAHAQAAGFVVNDRRIGTLPGTIVATIPAAQASGLNVQLLQYV
jgi:catechol 2,3-dioxygenase-like lactoylglutathione lyase family enzyme